MTYMDPNPMQNWNRRNVPVMDYESSAGSPAIATFFNAVYGWMAAGLALTGVVAWVVAHNQNAMQQVFQRGTIIILIIAQLALVWTISAAIHKISATAATFLFLLYAAINGLILSAIFLIYSPASIVSAFFCTAAMFGAMAVYGAFTKTDLSRLGNILFMALIGLIIATVVNGFMMSPGLYWICSYAGVVIFCGLTAYDSQRLRYIAMSTAGDPAMAARLSISGALALYLDFLNLFLYLLQIMNDNRRR